MGRKTADLIWSSFTKNGKGAECKHCKKSYVVANVTKMATHLSKCVQCPDKVRKAIRENRAEQDFARERLDLEDTSNDSTLNTTNSSSNTSFNTSASTPSTSNQRIRGFFDNITADNSLELQQKMAKAIYVTGAPLGLFDHPLWIDFFNAIRPSYKLPTRKVISTSLLDKEYTKMEADVSGKLNDAENLHLQCDGWSNCRNESIINFVVSCPTPLFVKFLETKDEAHNADYLFKQMEEVMQQYGVDKFFVAIGDNAANMQAGLKLLKEKYPHIQPLGCISHLMHLLCGDIIKCTSAKQIIDTAKHIIKRIKKSHKLSALFVKLQKQNDINCALKLPGKTRWGSTLFSLQSLSNNRDIVQMLVVGAAAQDKFKPSIKKNILSTEFWNKLNTFIKALTPVTAANIQLEGDDMLVHKVHKIMTEMEQKVVEALNLDSTFRPKDKQSIIGNLKTRKEQAIKPIHLAASMLFPNIRGSDLDANESIEAMEFIYETARLMSMDTKVLLTEIADYKGKTGLWKKEFVWNAINEMSPLLWWKTFYGQTNLAKVAARILSVPISSAATERSNSTFGWIHNKKRNRLVTQRAGKITFVAHNWKLLNPPEKKVKKVLSDDEDLPTASIDKESDDESNSDSYSSGDSSDDVYDSE